VLNTGHKAVSKIKIDEVMCQFNDATPQWLADANITIPNGFGFNTTGTTNGSESGSIVAPGFTIVNTQSGNATIGGSMTINIPLGLGASASWDHTNIYWGFVSNLAQDSNTYAIVDATYVGAPASVMTNTIADPHPGPFCDITISAAIGITVTSSLTFSGLVMNSVVPAVTSSIELTSSGAWSGSFYTASIQSLGFAQTALTGPFRVGIVLYVSTYNNGTGKWSYHDPLNQYYDRNLQFLDLIADVYFPTGGLSSDITSRVWRLKLPCPIILGPGQALVATFAVSNADAVYPTIVPFLRSSYEVLD
jgi:hypothetical protein